MMSLTFGLFTQVSGSGPLGPLVFSYLSSLAVKFGVVYSSVYFCMDMKIEKLKE